MARATHASSVVVLFVPLLMIPTVTLGNMNWAMNFLLLVLAAKMNHLMMHRPRQISFSLSIAYEEFKKNMTMTGGATGRRQLGSVNIAGVRLPMLILLNITPISLKGVLEGVGES